MSPRSGHAATNARLPAGVELAYDGLVLDVRGRRVAAEWRPFTFPDDPRPPWLVHPVLALGNFDGLHRGHLKIIERVQRGAAERGGTPMAMTFDPHPPRVVRPDKAPPLLMTTAQRLEALDRAGMQVRRGRPVHAASCRSGIRRRSCAPCWSTGCASSEVWVGANFLFGHERSGNFTLLRTLGQRYGFRAEKIDPVRYKDFVVSSTRIRRLVDRRARGRGGRAARPSRTSSTARSSKGAGAAASSAFRPRTSRPTTSCCRRTASTRRR